MVNTEKRVKQLITMDKIRIAKIIEIFQYSLIFTTLAVTAAHFVNEYVLFPVKKDDSVIKILIILSIELAFLTIVIFYLRKITLVVPSVAAFIFKKFRPYTTLDLGMAMILIFVFVGSIAKLNDKVDFLRKKMKQSL